MEKRILLASVLSLVILLGYNAAIRKYYPAAKTKTAITSPQTMSNLPEKTLVPEVAKPTVIQPISLESKELETKKLKIVFTNLGGRIKEVWFKDYNAKFFSGPSLNLESSQDLPFQFVRSLPDFLVLSYQDGARKITKKFQVKGDYLIGVEIIVEDLTGKKVDTRLKFSCFNLDLEALNKDPHWQKEKIYAEASISLPDKVLRINIARINAKSATDLPALVNWLGLRERYFCLLFKPEPAAMGYFVHPQSDKAIDIGLTLGNGVDTLKGVLYLGPQDSQILAGNLPASEQIMNFGTFDPISRLILKLLVLFHKVLPNWGLCIIALSAVIFLVLSPLTFKSMKSMRDMQKLQPQIEALRKQHQNDPQKAQKEIMELYRKYKINPFGGCLPLLLQIPIFFALYQALLRTVSLKGSSFLWIKDLSEPDRLMIFPSSIPILGNELNILPILMAVIMLFQQKLSMKITPSADPQQQKFMMVFMPILFGFMFYHFPGGLSLYWVVYSLLSLVFQWKQNPTPSN